MRAVLYIALLFGVADCGSNDSSSEPAENGKVETNKPNDHKPSTTPSEKGDLGSGGDNIVLKVNNIVADDQNSTADILISAVDGNVDLVKSGNDFFDDDVDIDIHWYCARFAGYPTIHSI